MRRPINADSAIMHWSKNIIALKAQGRTIQIFDLSVKQKLKSAVMNEDIVYWKWFSEKALGLVTETSVYHWDVYDATQENPVKMFDRLPNLSGCQIINYRVNAEEKWMVVVGISQQQGRVVGSMQLYSKERGISQFIEGHAAAFADINVEGSPLPHHLFTFAVRTQTGAKLQIAEIDHQEPNPRFQKKAVEVYFPQEAVNDFPVAMQVSTKYDIVYLVTKYGFIHLYDLETGTCIFMNRISSETIFTTAADTDGAGLVGVNRKGQVLSVSVDENTIIEYLMNNPAMSSLAVKLASRAGLPGADHLYQQQFDTLINAGNFGEAAKVAANSPRGFLRTPETITRFKNAPQTGQMSVILQYFGMLLDKGSLNRYESVELVRPVLQQNRKHLLEKWMNEHKLEASEELGDIIRPYDVSLALKVYLESNVPHKVVAGLAETGQFDQILSYSKKVGYQPDYTQLLQHIVRVNPEKGAEFASQLASEEDGALVDLDRVVDVFLSQNMIQQATSFLLDALKDNKPEHGHLQTRLLEMNLVNAPQVADAILGNEIFTHYDRPRIAQLCENAGLVQRALENSDDPAVIKRNIVKTDKLSPEWLMNYFGRLSVEQTLECLDFMLEANIRQNLQAVVQIATKFSDLLGPNRLIDLFEKYRTAEGLYYYLGSIVNLSEDADVHFKYIEAATAMNQLTEVERICRESNYYNPEKVKNFLKEAHLTEQLPLIIVCDRFNFIHDLVLYLYQNQQFKSIEVYVQRVNPSRAPAVVGGLLDVDCDESIIKNLLSTVDPSVIPIDELVSEVESRNRLKLLLPFLEATLATGNQQQAVYNALAKIYIDSNNNPEKFLKENDLYDTLIVGKYCEKRDPNLAYIAYSKGQNDLELISITNENSMYRAQARYLVDRADPEIWTFVLSENNLHRRSLVDQVIATAVPESTEPDKVSVAVKCFLDADLPGELIELLEKIILEPSPFSDNTSLQNLLMLTAAKADKSRLMDYIHQLNEFSADEIAEMCISVGLYEEAFEIYKKVNNQLAAVNVNEACVDKKEFRLAQICGLNLIVHAEELQALVRQYERNGYFDELISVLEAGLGLERAHMGMFTELGIALSKYHPDRVMEHLKLFWSRINIPKMIRACEEANLWPELVFLYCHYDEWDNAALAMMERAADAWEHHSFKDIVVKVANLEIYYRSLTFYLQEQPLLITDLLQALTPRIDVGRVVRLFKSSDNLPLIKPFMLNVQSQNKRGINDAINELLIEEEDYKTLRDSVDNHDNFDSVDLARRLEKHELIFFRQIAASIYRNSKRWEKSIALSKEDKLYKDAIETAAISAKSEVVEDLLHYFVDIGSRECYVGMLYACYDLIRPDVIMEISWRKGLHDFTMPFMINFLCEQTRTIEMLKKDNEERKSREKTQQTEEDNTPILGGSRLMLTQGPVAPASPMPYGGGQPANGLTPQATGYRAF
ncbi:Putative Clathrin heavy chain [Penicillium brasilianum]|uniref:Clathrin heavy chain n=1 Tax=Penicillium brasilianum TaxID=104259 RepID=A0A0F7THM3_PENBI|nr:Putative Clathrin heavy chain [Penicillium brasilianum]